MNMARSAAASRARGATRRALPRLALLVALVVAGSSMSVSAVSAGKSSGLTGDIALAGGEASAQAGEFAGPLTFGAAASFDTSVSGRMSQGYLYISVVCKQGGTVVYQWSSRDLGFDFPLVDQAGQGLEWDGGDADCSGNLVYRIDGRKPTIQTLDSTAFAVEGA